METIPRMLRLEDVKLGWATVFSGRLAPTPNQPSNQTNPNPKAKRIFCVASTLPSLPLEPFAKWARPESQHETKWFGVVHYGAAHTSGHQAKKKMGGGGRRRRRRIRHRQTDVVCRGGGGGRNLDKGQKDFSQQFCVLCHLP